MKQLRQVWIIIKTTFKNWVRYPENMVGLFLYLGFVAIIGYAFSLSGTQLGVNPVPYYAAGILVYSIVGQQNTIFAQFGIWREDLLSKPVSLDVFLLGSFFGSLLTTSLPSFIIFIAVLFLYKDSFIISNGSLVILSILLGIISAIGMGYIFAALGLRLLPQGFLLTSITFIITIFSGILLPIPALPARLRIFSYLIPYTWSIDLFRYSMLGSTPLLPPNQEIKYLVASILITVGFGKIFLSYTLNAIRKKKVIIR